MPKTLTQMAAELGMSVASFQSFLKQRGDLRCVDEEATFTEAEEQRLRQALSVENAAAPNAGVTGMTVDHFKAFGAVQRVPLRPITLIFGQNSVGKSSFLHALLWAHHVAATGELDVVNPILAGNSVHLGGFDNVVYRRQSGHCFSLAFEVQTPQLNTFFPEPVRFCAGMAFRRPRPSARDLTPDPVASEYTLEVDHQLLLKARRENAADFALEYLDIDHPLFKEIFKRIARLRVEHRIPSKADTQRIRSAAESLCRRIHLTGGRLLPKRVALEELPPRRRGGNTVARAWVEIVEATLPQLLHALVSTAAERVNDYLHSLSYLGPLRAYPDRGFSLNDRTDPNWRAGGGRAWELLRDEARLRAEVNAFLGKDHLQTGYAFKLNRFVDIQAAAQRLAEKLPRLKKGGAASLEALLEAGDLPHRSELAMVDLNNRMEVSHRDVGVGLSQVVPVLVLAAASRSQTVIVEQPELHIHPALQADLGDIFVKSALLHGNRFILETHSEHLMLRLLKRVRQSSKNDPAYPKNWPKLTPEMISVVYAKAEKDGTRMVPIALSSDGDFETHWPDGFFTERGRELFT